MPEDIDTFNKFGVFLRGEHIGLTITPRGLLTKTDALSLAAWLVALADFSDPPVAFLAILRAIREV